MNVSADADGTHRGAGFDPTCKVCCAYKRHLEVAQIIADRPGLLTRLRWWRW